MKTSRAHLQDRPYVAFGWILLSSICFASMTAFVKRLAPTLPQFELVLFRSVTMLFLVYFALPRPKSWFPKTGWRLLVFRGLMGFCGLSCFFYGAAHLPLAIASLLNWSSVIFVIVISQFFLNEKHPVQAWFWSAVAFFGLVLLVNPALFSATSLNSLAGPALHAHGGLAIALLGAFFSGLALTAVRAATRQFGHGLIIFYLSVISLFLSALALIAQGLFVWPHGRQWIELLGLGLSGGFAQIAMTLGYREAPAPVVTTMSLMTAAFSAILGWWIFGETLEKMQWLGMVTVAIGIVFATRATKR